MKTFTGVQSKNPRLERIAIEVGDNGPPFEIQSMIIVITYDIADDTGLVLGTKTERVDIVPDLPPGTMNQLQSLYAAHIRPLLDAFDTTPGG